MEGAPKTVTFRPFTDEFVQPQNGQRFCGNPPVNDASNRHDFAQRLPMLAVPLTEATNAKSKRIGDQPRIHDANVLARRHRPPEQ